MSDTKPATSSADTPDDADHAADELQQQLAQRDATIREQQRMIDMLDRRQAIDSLLRDADTIDLEAARLLTEAALAQMSEPDLEAAIADVREARPYLFNASNNKGAASTSKLSAQSARVTADDTAPHLKHAAAEAQVTGNRGDLLRYLRLRRAAS